MATKVQVIFYSMYGHIYKMAEAVAAGVREVPGVEVSLYQVPELVPDAVLERSGAKKARDAFAHIPIATVNQLPDADAIIFARRRDLETWRRRCATFSINAAGYGYATRWWAKSAAFSPALEPNTAARKPPSPVFIPRCCISA